MKDNSIEKKIENYIRASFPVLCINTKEEKKSLISIKNACEKLDREFWCWSITRGIVDLKNSQEVDNTDDPIRAIREATSSDGKRVLCILDPNREFESPVFIREIRDRIDDLRNGVTLIFMGVHVNIPDDLSMVTTVIEPKLPDRDELRSVLSQIMTDNELEFSFADYDRQRT